MKQELPFAVGLSAKERVSVSPEPTGGAGSGSLQVEQCCRRAQRADFKSSNPFQYQHGRQYRGMNGLQTSVFHGRGEGGLLLVLITGLFGRYLAGRYY